MTQQITLVKDKILSDNYFTLHNITYDLTRKDGEVIRHKREVYDRGNGATILLYNVSPCTTLLTISRAKMAKLSAINVKFTIAVMVRRSSCTTRRKRPWF